MSSENPHTSRSLERGVLRGPAYRPPVSDVDRFVNSPFQGGRDRVLGVSRSGVTPWAATGVAVVAVAGAALLVSAQDEYGSKNPHADDPEFTPIQGLIDHFQFVCEQACVDLVDKEFVVTTEGDCPGDVVGTTTKGQYLDTLQDAVNWRTASSGWGGDFVEMKCNHPERELGRPPKASFRFKKQPGSQGNRDR